MWWQLQYSPLEVEDLFLSRALRPFVEEYIWKHRGHRVFFDRVSTPEGNSSVRIRMRADEAFMTDTLRPAFADWMHDRGTFTETAPVPESEADVARALLTDHHHLSSRVVLDRLWNIPDLTYGDRLYDILRLHTILIYTAGLDRVMAPSYFERLTAAWLPYWFGQPTAENPTALYQEFDTRLAPQYDTLRYVLDALWQALQREQFDKAQPEWARWFEGNQAILMALEKEADRALPGFMAATANRMGISGQDSVFLWWVLSKVLR
jgi:hypothetical protein